MGGFYSLVNTPIMSWVSRHRYEVGLALFVVFVCMVDVVTSFQSEYGIGPTLGQMTKPFIFLSLLMYCIFMKRYRLEVYIVTLLFLYIMGVEIVNAYIHQELSYFTVGISGAFKTTLPFYTYFFLKERADAGCFQRKHLDGIFLLYCAVVVFNVIFPVMMGISFSNYKEGGYSGFYQAGNELNAFIVLSLPMLIYYAMSRRSWMIAGLMLLMTLCALLTGSKSTLGSVLLSYAFVPFLFHWTRYISIPVIMGLGVAGVMLVWEYLDKIVGLFSTSGIYARLAYTLKQNTSILDILLGVRVQYFGYYLNEFENSSWGHILFGKGYQYAHEFMFPIVGKTKSAEMDIIDFIARYGLLGWTLMAFILLWTLIKHVNFKSTFTWVFLFSFGLLSLNAILAGHVLSNSFLVFHLAVLFTINYLAKRSEV